MKINLLFTSAIFCFGFQALSQNTAPGLQLPSTPALSIIGVQNSEISQPSSPSGLNLSLISPVISGNGTLPSDLALEFAPFYLKKGDYTWKDINEPNFWQDFKFSIATNQVQDTAGQNFGRLGIGFRSYIIGNTILKTFRGEITSLSILANVNSITESFDDVIGEGSNNISEELYLFAVGQVSGNPDFIIQAIRKILDDHRDNLKGAQAELKELSGQMNTDLEAVVTSLDFARRSGNYLQLAGAVALDFPDNNFESYAFNRVALWLDYTYKISNPLFVLDISALSRISNHSFDPTVIFENTTVFGDLGFALNLDIPTLKLVGQLEFIGKLGITDVEFVSESGSGTFSGVSESKWTGSLGYRIGETNNLVNISLSSIISNEQYIRTDGVQFLLGYTMALWSPE